MEDAHTHLFPGGEDQTKWPDNDTAGKVGSRFHGSTNPPCETMIGKIIKSNQIQKKVEEEEERS